MANSGWFLPCKKLCHHEFGNVWVVQKGGADVVQGELQLAVLCKGLAEQREFILLYSPF